MPIPIFTIVIVCSICIGPPVLRKASKTINKIRSRIYTKLYHKQFIKNTRKTKQEKDDCVICMDNYSENHKCSELYCGHKFHHSCILEWMNEKKTCPLCNTGFMLVSGEIYGKEKLEYDSFYSQFEDN